LHRSFTGCAFDVAQGKRSQVYINLIRRYIDLLLRLECHVILVFDGQPLPAKKDTNQRRSQSRSHNLELGLICMENGDRAQAFKHFQMSAGITPDIVQHAIEEFRTILNVDIIVAPYEADAQLAHLIKSGIADAVVTEDSDLIPFGCETIIFKLKEDSSCVIYERKLLHKCVNRGLASKFNFDVFRRICIMSGCDYFPDGIPKVGLQKSVNVFSKSIFASEFSEIVKLLKRVPRYLDLKKVKISDRMIQAFVEAEFTFLHQIVFDPITRSHIPLFDYFNIPPEVEAFLKVKADPFWFAGKPLPAEDAFRRAIGNFDLSVADVFKMDDPPTWSIYNPERLKNLKKVEPSLQFVDSGYSSNNSQPDDDTVVPETPDDPYRDSPAPEEIELLSKLCELNRLAAERSEKVSINISSTPSTPLETFGTSLNKPAIQTKTNKDANVTPAPQCNKDANAPSAAGVSSNGDLRLEQSVVMSAEDNDSANQSTTSAKDENASPPAALPSASSLVIKRWPSGPARTFGFRTPTSIKRKAEVVTVASRDGPSPQTNEIFKPRRSMNAFSIATSRSNHVSSNSFMTPRGVKRHLTEISGNESINHSMAKPGPSSAFRATRPVQKLPVKSGKPRTPKVSLSPRLYKTAFPTVEFPKQK
jgi:exonuclease-1